MIERDVVDMLKLISMRLEAEERSNPGGVYILGAYREQITAIAAEAAAALPGAPGTVTRDFPVTLPVSTTGTEPASLVLALAAEAGLDDGPAGHVVIAEHPEFFKSDGLYNVDIKTTLCLTHAEVDALADFLADACSDDLAGEVNAWLDENPAKCRKCGKPEGDEGWIGLCDDCDED